VNWIRAVTRKGFTLGDEALVDRQEQAFLKASANVLVSNFLNPARSGCPEGSLLRQIAANKLRFRDAAPWMKHLASCSECFRDFRKYKQAAHRQKAVTIACSTAAAAALLTIVISVGVWRSHKREVAHRDNGHTEITSTGPKGNGQTQYLPFALDLRGAAQVRSPNGTSPSVVKLPKMPLHVLADLPLGSDSGEYAVSLNKEGKPVWSGTTNAQIRNKRMVAEFDSNLAPFAPGRYALVLSSKSGMRLRQNIDLEEQTKRE
jgi:hypothetical protein